METASLETGTDAVANGMDSAAASLRDVRELLAGMRQLITQRPGPALLIAVVLGFVIARSLSGR